VASDPAIDARQIYARRRPVSDPDAQRYLLPPEEGIRIFREEIVPDLLAEREQQEKPTVVFLVGQHGAGKSRVASMVADVLNKRGGFADLDSDLYKPYHPRYDDLMRRDDTLMAAYIGPDSWAWLTQAHENVRARKINVLKPETGQDSRGAAGHMRAYRDAGFRVEVMVVAVPAAMSNQGIVSRYHEQVVDRGHGRLTVQANADRAYTGVLDLADVIDGERLADEVGVFRRGEATPRYSNALNAVGHWQAIPALRAAIESERARPWTPEEAADFARTHTKLRRELGPQWTQRLDEILDQAQPLMNRSRQAASEPAGTQTDPRHAAEPNAGDEARQALEAARAAAAAASARQALERRQAGAEAEDADRRQAADWHAAADQQHEASQQPEHNERDTGAEADR
jgi:Zeta toxin